MPLEEMMWVEKYRPKKLEDLANQASMKERLTSLLEKKGELPHLLFAGPPGSGKTTTALIIVKEILGDLSSDYTLSLNASDERGIDMVRERVKNFARYSDRRDGVPFRLIILDEADSMTADAQTALRRIMGRVPNSPDSSSSATIRRESSSPCRVGARSSDSSGWMRVRLRRTSRRLRRRRRSSPSSPESSRPSTSRRTVT